MKINDILHYMIFLSLPYYISIYNQEKLLAKQDINHYSLHHIEIKEFSIIPSYPNSKSNVKYSATKNTDSNHKNTSHSTSERDKLESKSLPKPSQEEEREVYAAEIDQFTPFLLVIAFALIIYFSKKKKS
ncbi:hypothetical protein [Chryseobacterium sp. HR92]|uniref:hypothetical protein n=1 Tax=Chryseobacterium sp. HR92 TaxID=3094839 RepID=UPI00388D0D3A|nr:hypothetical protein SFA27_08040 [Chryseobacterium sp. HR92]